VTNYRRFWGLDPGMNGAAAFVAVSPIPPYPIEYAEVVSFARVPNEAGKTRVTGRPTTTLTNGGMDFFLQVCRESDEVAIERVCAMPSQGRKQGATSSFTFGMNVGILWGALELSGVPLEAIAMVAPQSWKAFFKLTRRPKAAAAELLLENAALCPELAGRVRSLQAQGHLNDTSHVIGEVDALWLATFLALKKGAKLNWVPLPCLTQNSATVEVSPPAPCSAPDGSS
jgi:hypothetical protein